MSKYLLCVGAGLCLVGLLVRVEARAADDSTLPAELEKVTKDAAGKKWDDAVKDGDPITKKYDPEQVMHLLAKRNPKDPKKGGIGVDPKAEEIEPDGIEAKIINMIRQGIPQDEMAKLDDFKKMADQVAAIAGITHKQDHDKKKDDADGSIWKKSSADMFEKAKDFKKAIESKDQAKIKAAAKALDGTCKDCHGVYRP